MIAHDPQSLLNLTALLALLTALALVRRYGRNAWLTPDAVILLLGLGYGLLIRGGADLPVFEPSPSLVMVYLLPALIFASARELRPGAMRSVALPIALYALPGVVATVWLVAWPLHYFGAFPLADALLMASAIAATSPAAVAGVMARYRAPPALTALVEGEALFNDGAAITLFLVFASLLLEMQTVSLGDTALRVAWTLAGALPLGALAGWSTARLLDGWRADPDEGFFRVTLTLTMVYGVFLLAEGLLAVSGVLAVVIAAWTYAAARRYRGDGATGHADPAAGFWDFAGQVAGALLLFGLGVAVGRHFFPLDWVVPGILLLLTGARLAMVYGGAGLLALTRRRLLPGWPPMLALAGARGPVCAALVLMIPAGYPQRDLMLCLALLCCLFTQLAHPVLARRYLRGRPPAPTPAR